MTAAVAPELIAFAHRLADEAAAIVRASARIPRSVQAKADASPVTQIDRAVETRLRELIADAWPGHGVLGEEFAAHDPDAEHVWVIDPIDGTKQFMVGMAAYGTLLALARDGVPVLGLIDQPITRERWLGVEGGGAWYGGEPMRARACPALDQAILCTTSPEYFEGGDRAAYERLVGATRWTVYGGNCIVFGQLAAGFVDVAFETGVDPYDYCGLAPIVANAGGVMSDWEGRPLTLGSGERIVATGDPALHERVLGVLRKRGR